ncbi:Glu-tRNA(Gln) amidotransferase subunit GatD [Candidatus Woesearchaeota archaeon]|nr:Glu-tRNA(Gln) amidotransferase subunit GatD [Candidatus Woesearchaeota archaeon]
MDEYMNKTPSKPKNIYKSNNTPKPKSTPQPGDHVTIICRDNISDESKYKEYEGILMPNENTANLVLKLDNGYNIGIERSKIKKINLIKKHNESKTHNSKTFAGEKISFNNNKPTITILHTGGTIASKVDYETGGVVARFTPKELLDMFPELGAIANIKSRLVRNMWSQDMRFAHYNLLAKEIQQEVKAGVEGIIITHGTDTLHYTSAALSFILNSLPIPVILVGAQRSSDRGSSDASFNLICAAKFIAETDFADVAICMHESSDDKSCVILQGLKCRKMHTSRRDAFKPVNTTAIARVNLSNIEFINPNYSKKHKNKTDLTENKTNLKIMPFKELIKIGILTQRTNMYANEFLFYKNYSGLIIEATGLGNPPTSQIDTFTKEHKKIFEAIRTLIKKGVVVAIAPQTIYGRINLNVYSNQREIKQIGVLGDGCDMTTETAYLKLAWLLSNFTREEVKKLYEKNIKGEISERTGSEFQVY